MPRRGRKRAIVAVAHSLVTSLYFMLLHDIPYDDLGGDSFDRRDRDRREQRALATLRNLGYDVTLSQRPDPPTPRRLPSGTSRRSSFHESSPKGSG